MLLGKRYLLSFLALLVVAVVYTAPARVLVSLMNLEQQGVVLQGLHGPWHSAQASMLHIEQSRYAIRLSNVNWRLRPLSLLTGAVTSDLSAEFAAKPWSATVSRSLFGSIDVENLTGELHAEDIRPALTALIFPIDGKVQLADVALEHDGEWLQKLGGRIQARGVAVTAPMGRIELGSVLFDLGMRDTTALADIASYQGAFDLQGGVELQAKNYQLRLSSAPDDTIENSLRQQMKMFFGPEVDGRFHFEYGGPY